MRLLLIFVLLLLSSCDVITVIVNDMSSAIEPIPIANQRGFAGTPSDEVFLMSTFAHDDVTNWLWWDGNIGIQKAGILSGRYSLFVNGVDSGVYSYVDAPIPNGNYKVQYVASTGYGGHEANQYGIIFDYRDSSNYAVFIVNGYGKYILGYFDDANWRPLVDGVIEVEILKRSFLLSVTIIDNHIYSSVNDYQLESVSFPQDIIGKSGIYLGSRKSDTASLLIDEFSISPID